MVKGQEPNNSKSRRQTKVSKIRAKISEIEMKENTNNQWNDEFVLINSKQS